MQNTNQGTTQSTTQNTAQQQLEIQRLYVKGISLESPSVPDVFKKKWEPEITVNLDVKHTNIEIDFYEVSLSIIVTAKMENKTVFLVEVNQAGIFKISGFNADQMDHILKAYCPNILFPYVREVISDVITRGSFPQFFLSPINFEAIYMQKKQEEAAAKEKGGASSIN